MYIQFNSTMRGRNICYLRKKRCMTQKALAKCLRIDSADVRYLESKKHLPLIDYDVLCRISLLFGVGISDLTETDLSLCASE